MESVFGIKGKDFVLVVADSYAAYSIVRLKDNEDKIAVIDGNKLVASAGPQGDRAQFVEYVKKNINLYRIRTGISLSTNAAANYIRNELASCLRRNPYQVNVIVAGCDADGPKLFWMDYMASMAEINKGAHGYAGYFLGGLLDRWWKPEMTEAEALDVAQKCAAELRNRFLISQSKFTAKIITKDGVKNVDL
eukprot:GDKI01044052.1.p2 GENE.GDKI01044052.1~~GDKI01044052.1.p2  ORF type:complete len:212 (-),score=76.82 GDKI01044052.1:35-610(-)